jgi:ech hydrogenase subunit D
MPQMQVQTIQAETIVAIARDLRERKARLVQIGATKVTGGVELTYTFDLAGAAQNYRFTAAWESSIPSISQVYWCAFLYENEIHDLFGVRVEGMAVDFKGSLYQTTLKHAMGLPKTVANTATATT